MEPTTKIWMDGELVDWADAKVHVMSHALHYGTGVFEGIRVYHTDEGQAIFRHRDHIKRLLDSAKVLGMDVPYTLDELIDANRETVRANGANVDYLRPIAYLGGQRVGLNPIGVDVKVNIICVHMGSYLGEDMQANGATLITSSWEKPSNRAAALSAKICGNYVNSVLAKQEAIRAGADEALMINSNGNVAEGSGENVFLVRDGALHTPMVSDAVLEGITRNSVIELARDEGIEVVQRSMTRTELYVADEVFMTGTAAEVTPIRMIDNRLIADGKPGPVTKRLQALFANVASGRNQRYRRWLDVL